MGEPVRHALEIKEFTGMFSNYDPTDIPPGASRLQVNVQGYTKGVLEVRRGVRQVEFEEE